MITLITTDFCQQCNRTKMQLAMKNIPFSVVNLKQSDLTDEKRQELKEKFPNATSFPIILKDGEHVQLKDII